MSIDILMATYNSEKYLEQQLSSIITQSYENWRLIIRDDASHDNTIKIIEKYLKIYPGKIVLYKDDKNLGAKENFNKLLKLTDADYIMFADHDDYWLKDKIKLSLEKMKELEKTYSANTPLMVFTDKSIVDENLNIVCLSDTKAEKFDVKHLTPNKLLVQNVAAGCTMMINKTLLKISPTIPETAIMHDYYFTLLASFFGHIGYVDKPTMLYRQHSANEIGAKAIGFGYFIKKLKEKPETIKKRFMKNIFQGEVIFNLFNDKLSEDNKILLNDFIKLKTAKHFKFMRIIIKNRLFKSGVVRKLGMTALLF